MGGGGVGSNARDHLHPVVPQLKLRDRIACSLRRSCRSFPFLYSCNSRKRYVAGFLPSMRVLDYAHPTQPSTQPSCKFQSTAHPSHQPIPPNQLIPDNQPIPPTNQLLPADPNQPTNSSQPNPTDCSTHRCLPPKVPSRRRLQPTGQPTPQPIPTTSFLPTALNRPVYPTSGCCQSPAPAPPPAPSQPTHLIPPNRSQSTNSRHRWLLPEAPPAPPPVAAVQEHVWRVPFSRSK